MGLRSSIRMAKGAGRVAATSAGLVAALRLDEWACGIDAARTDRYVRRWAQATLAALHVEVITEPAPDHRTPLPNGLVVANHRSFVDIPLLLSRFGGPLLSRGDVADWPLLGWLASVGGTLYVDRADKSSGAAAVRRIVTRLRSGRSVGVFPEGTTFLDDEVRPFLAGAFLAARQAKRPIVPVGIAYAEPSAHFGPESFGEHAENLFALPHVTVGLSVGEPLEPSARTEVLAEAARQAVQVEVRRARSLVS